MNFMVVNSGHLLRAPAELSSAVWEPKAPILVVEVTKRTFLAPMASEGSIQYMVFADALKIADEEEVRTRFQALLAGNYYQGKEFLADLKSLGVMQVEVEISPASLPLLCPGGMGVRGARLDGDSINYLTDNASEWPGSRYRHPRPVRGSIISSLPTLDQMEKWLQDIRQEQDEILEKMHRER